MECLLGFDSFMPGTPRMPSIPIGVPLEDEQEIDIRLPDMIQSERMFLYADEDTSKNDIEALTLACKAEQVLIQGDIMRAKNLTITAYRKSATSEDALRMMARLSTRTDPGTSLSIIRELLHTMRPKWANVAKNNPGEFYNVGPTRRFMRLNWDAGVSAEAACINDVACYAYEESIRLNTCDNRSARDFILPMYIKIFGLCRQGVSPIKRDMKHLYKLLTTTITPGRKGSVFADDEICVRWGNIFMKWYDKRPWQSDVMSEYGKSKWMFKLFFGEIDHVPKPEIPSRGPNDKPLNFANGFIIGNHQDDARKAGKQLLAAFSLWPEFLSQMYRLVKPHAPEKKFEIPAYVNILKNVDKQLDKARSLLESARGAMREGDMKRAIEELSLSRALYGLYAHSKQLPWHTVIDYAVVSNRATCAEAAGEWMLCRFDSRVTLSIQPKHLRTYKRIPSILRALLAWPLAEKAEQLYAEAANGAHTDAEWEALAARGIMLLSLPAIIQTRNRRFNKRREEEALRTGINDMYTSVNWPVKEHKMLPWLTESDVDPGY